MAKVVETRISKNRGLNFNQALYPNRDGNYSPIVLEIEQLRERGLWANDPQITTKEDVKKDMYQDFFDHFFKMPLLPNFKLFEKRLYRWGAVALLVRFYGDKTNYSLNFETRKVSSINMNMETNELQSVNTVWYFSNNGFDYRVTEVWTKNKVTRKLVMERTNLTIDLDEWNQNHSSNLQVRDWNHNYGVIPVLPVINSITENGNWSNGFENALIHINQLDRLGEEIKYETIATRSKTYYDTKAFERIIIQNKEPIKQVISDDDIINSTIIGVNVEETGFIASDNMNDKLKSKVPIYVAQFNRATLDPLLQQEEKLTTKIYSMLGFTNPNATVQVVRTATEMEYYNENTASTLKTLSLDRSNMLRDFVGLIIQIGKNMGISGFDQSMTVDHLLVKVIPNLKTDENLFFDYYKKKYDSRIISFQEFKEIIDNLDKEAVDEWLKENNLYIGSDTDVQAINTLSQTSLFDKLTLLKIFFKGTVDDAELDKIITKAEEEQPQGMDLGFDFNDEDGSVPQGNRRKQEEDNE